MKCPVIKMLKWNANANLNLVTKKISLYHITIECDTKILILNFFFLFDKILLCK